MGTTRRFAACEALAIVVLVRCVNPTDGQGLSPPRAYGSGLDSETGFEPVLLESKSSVLPVRRLGNILLLYYLPLTFSIMIHLPTITRPSSKNAIQFVGSTWSFLNLETDTNM